MLPMFSVNIIFTSLRHSLSSISLFLVFPISKFLFLCVCAVQISSTYVIFVFCSCSCFEIYFVVSVSSRFFSGFMTMKHISEWRLHMQKNFKLEKVCKLNRKNVFFCMTFRARNAETDECHLFRGVVLFRDVLLCEIMLHAPFFSIPILLLF